MSYHDLASVPTIASTFGVAKSTVRFNRKLAAEAYLKKQDEHLDRMPQVAFEGAGDKEGAMTFSVRSLRLDETKEQVSSNLTDS